MLRKYRLEPDACASEFAGCRQASEGIVFGCDSRRHCLIRSRVAGC
jgi:hypothetical protein